MTYTTQFQGHFKGLCNRNLLKIVLNYVVINTKAAITSIHVILLPVLAVLRWSLGTLFTNGQNLNIAWHQYSKQIKYEYVLLKVINDGHIKTNGLYFVKWILQFFSGVTTIEIPERQVNFAHVESLKLGQRIQI